MKFYCPVCKKSLFKQGRTFQCENRHCFDISSEGYVNFLLSNKMKSKMPGDSKEMVAARHRFLNAQHYRLLKEAVAARAYRAYKEAEHIPSKPVLIDAGCGEGYYTSGIYQYFQSKGVGLDTVGFDISKPAVRTAAKRGESVEYAVASIFDLPVSDSCADFVISIFAPICPQEYYRILKPKGILMIVAPGKKHLFALKEILYEHPYENDKNVFKFKGLQNLDIDFVQDEIVVDSHEDISCLFTMTPYFWKTSKQAAQKLEYVESLRTRIEFEIHVLQKI